MIHIKHEATFFGANPFAVMPVLVASLDLANNTSEETKILEEGSLRLHTIFPEWVSGAPDLQRQSVAEIVAQKAVQWALGALNEVRGLLYDAGATATPEGARLWLGFHHPEVSRSALNLALKILIQAGQYNTFDQHGVDSDLASLWQLCRRHHPDYQARILMQAARVKNIPVLPFIPDTRYWQFGWGSRSRIFFESMSNADGQLGYQFQSSKVSGKAVFAALGFSTPEHLLVNHVSELAEAAEKVGWPCVVKPLFCGGGKGVTAGIRSISELEAAFAHARCYTNNAVMVEKFIPGDDHRLMVIDGKLFAAIRRAPSTVTGNGTSTILQLLAALNCSRSLNMMKSGYLRPVESDQILEQQLERQGVDLDTVLHLGRTITLRSNANLSTGGTCTDVTERVHPHVKHMAETVAKTMGLTTVGIDYITTDIEKSWQEGGNLIEANTTPGLDAIIAAGQDPVIVGTAVLGTIPARIPVQLLVVQQSDVDQAKTYLKSMTSSKGVGWTCNGEAGIDDMPLCITPTGPWKAVHVLLRHKVVHQARVVCVAEDIVCHGMPLDKVNHVVLCGDELELPSEWLQVLIDHSEAVERFSSWQDFISKSVNPLLTQGGWKQ